MKLGFITAICDGMTFEEVVDFAAENGLECLEVACWPQGGAQRRYAGVSHIDVANLTQEKADEIKAYCKKKGVEISSLAYYPNTLEPNLEKRQSYIDHLYKLMDASVMLDVNMITTFVGRDPKKSVSENLEIVKEVWPPIVKYAEEKGVKIGIENCPMLFTEDEWPGGQNLMTSPANWRKVFEIIDSPNFGINYDPSHFVWQQIDYIKPIYEFKDKIFHVHYKDIKVFKDKLADVGTMATPLEYMSPKLPGLGDVDWGKYVSALTDIGYDGYTCIEVEDKAFEKSMDDGVPQDEAVRKLAEAGATGPAFAALQGMYGFVQFRKDCKAELEGLKEIMPYCFHMHGKCHYVSEDLKEASIPYNEIMPVIQNSDFDGYIVTEYEDHNSGNAEIMTRRHVAMMKKLLGR